MAKEKQIQRTEPEVPGKKALIFSYEAELDLLFYSKVVLEQLVEKISGFSDPISKALLNNTRRRLLLYAKLIRENKENFRQAKTCPIT